MITPFINDELNIKELELFLDHVFTCHNCREEVEIYYTLLTAMKQLDEDKSLSGDFKHELERKLEEAQEKVIHAKYTYYRKKAILILIITVIAFIINFSYTSDIVDIGNIVTESDFHIRKSFKSESYYDLELQLQKYMNEKNQ
jgi:predicted house-cleaning noncanonical NTP pyrophosphatase (MazG superfamily)